MSLSAFYSRRRGNADKTRHKAVLLRPFVRLISATTRFLKKRKKGACLLACIVRDFLMQ